jgi:nicotinamide riboside kinase
MENVPTNLISKTVRRVCLWGGPGSGKSTSAALVFARLKVAGLNVELVSEYVKAWAYENRKIDLFDQVYIFAKQQRLEDRVLRTPIQAIVTDSPLLMQCVYAKRYNAPCWQELVKIGKVFDSVYPSVNLLLRRVHGEYQQLGRYQDFDEAKKIDAEIKTYLEEIDVPYTEIDNDSDAIAEYAQRILT